MLRKAFPKKLINAVLTTVFFFESPPFVGTKFSVDW
jgi:hypothetical protein